MKAGIQLVIIVILTSLTGCMDADPFGMTKKEISKGYLLHQFESGDYYLEKDGKENAGGGIIDGIVLEIGWTQQVIAAKRKANYSSDQDGWMIIDTQTGQIQGPLNEKEFKMNFTNMQTYSAKEAWNQL